MANTSTDQSFYETAKELQFLRILSEAFLDNPTADYRKTWSEAEAKTRFNHGDFRMSIATAEMASSLQENPLLCRFYANRLTPSDIWAIR